VFSSLGQRFTTQIMAAGVFWSTLMTFWPLLQQAPGFQQVCSAQTKAQRRQRVFLMARRRWMQQEEDFDTPKDLDVFFIFYRGVS
jgi:hypothetical protein